MTSLRPVKKSLLLLLYLTFIMSVPDGMAFEKVLDSGAWKRIESKHVILQYKRFEDIKELDGNITYSPDGWSFKDLFSSDKPEDQISSVTQKLDGIFKKVQNILDMRGKTKKVTINVYPNTEQLHEAYFAITGTKCNYKAWYIFELNTIYVTIDNVHEGIIAHEMAHFIIDHYFSVRPPRVTAEILSRYVDQHLNF